MTNQISIEEFVSNAAALYNTKRDGRAIPVLLRGRPGQGKSSFIEGRLRHELEDTYGVPVDVITDMPAQRDAPDYRGFLIPHKTADGTPESRYTKPDLLSRIEKSPAYEGGIVILFLDELLQADQLTQKVLTDLILNGRLGEYQLPNNVWILCASNYQEDGAGVNRALTILTNRMVTLDVYLPLPTWTGYAKNLKLHPVCIDFVQFRPELVFTDEVPRRDGPFPTPRSFTDACRYLSQQAKKDVIPTDGFARAIVAGLVGEACMLEFFAYVDDAQHLPKLKDILAKPSTCKVPSETKLSAQYAAAQLLVRSANSENVNELWTYAERLIKDMQAKIANDLLANKFGGVLFNAPAFTKWVAENKSLLANTFS